MTDFDEGTFYIHRLHLLLEESKELDMGALGPGDPMGHVSRRITELAKELAKEITAARQRSIYAPECSICRRRHGIEIIHPCE